MFKIVQIIYLLLITLIQGDLGFLSSLVSLHILRSHLYVVEDIVIGNFLGLDEMRSVDGDSGYIHTLIFV